MAAPDRQTFRVALVALLVVAAVGLTATVHGLTELDTALRQWVLDHRSAGLTTAATVVTVAGSAPLLTPVALVLALVLGVRGHRCDALLVGTTTLGVLVLGPLLKSVVERQRPPEDHLVEVSTFAYPSGHSLTSMAVLGVLTALAARHLATRPARAAAVTTGVLLITAVGISRVYLGVHWPTDVLAGWLIGSAWLALCLLIAAHWPTSVTRSGRPGAPG